MQRSSHIAYKEWAVICAALAEGRQALLLRKGGIHEGHGGFELREREFWLFPTYLHQRAEEIIAEAEPLLARVLRERPPDDSVRIGLYVALEDAIELSALQAALKLVGQHVWSHRTVDARFHYKRPGLFVLPARVYRVPQPFELPNSPHFAGCRTWVDLPEDLPTAGAMPVLDDAEFARRVNGLHRAIGTRIV